MLQEFKEFAMRGNVLDLAIGVIIGGAFGKIVTSLVNDLLMPLIGILLGGVDFSKLQYVYGSTVLKYGLFIQSIVDFLIITFSIFLFVKAISSFKKKEEAVIVEEAPQPGKEEILLTEIRDLLKAK